MGSPLIRKRVFEAMRLAAFAPSLPRSSPATNTRPMRVSPAALSRSAAAICAARMPFASHAPRPYSTPSSTRLGKNGGTQSKWVEKTTSGSPTAAMTLIRGSDRGIAGSGDPGLLENGITAARAGSPRELGDRSLIPGRRFDVDQRARERRPDRSLIPAPDPRSLTIHCFELRPRIRLVVAVFHDHRRRQRQSPFLAGANRHGTRAGYDDGALAESPTDARAWA